MKARGKLGKLKKNKIVLPGAKQQNGWSAQNQRENKKFVNKEAVRHGLLNSRVSKRNARIKEEGNPYSMFTAKDGEDRKYYSETLNISSPTCFITYNRNFKLPIVSL